MRSEGAPLGFEPENALEQAMLEALVDPAAMPRFHAQLAEERLLVPLHQGHVETPEGALAFAQVEFEGRVGVPAFTSVTQLARAMPPGTECALLTGRELASGWDDRTALLVNPRGALGIALEADTVRQLA